MMKQCMICHHVNESDTWTCLTCGEASWGPDIEVLKKEFEGDTSIEDAPKKRSRR